MDFVRQLDLAALLKKKSFFLFGPRATGKSHLLQTSLGDHMRLYDLLDARVYSNLLRRPSLLEEEALPGDQRIVVIDEVQKLPSLLDEVHRLIERRKMRFLLTGSSTRKLLHGGANLLAGRAWTAALFPLVSNEIPHFDLLRYLNSGGLPAIYPSTDYREELKSYAETYLSEEIRAEALTRRVDHFARFLDVIALNNGEELRYQALASDTGINAKTIRNYVEILRDTLIGFELAAFRKTRTRKAIASSKLYLFDVGVVNALTKRGEIAAKSELFGRAFEHFLILELRAHLSYTRSDLALSYWRSTSQFEVDCIVGNKLAIEIKSTELVNTRDLRGLKALREEGLIERYLVVSLDSERRLLDGVEIWPWQMFLAALWKGQLLSAKH